MRLRFTNFHQFSSKIASFQKRSAPQFHRFSPIFVETCQFSNKECASISPIFTNFRRNLPVFKKGVRLNFINFHQFSSKIDSFQIRSAPKFHKFSLIFVENCQFSNKECASISPIFTKLRRKLSVFKGGVRPNFTNFRRKLLIFKKGISSEMVKFQIRSEGCRVGRAVSPIRFFDPILNNALALRASHEYKKFKFQIDIEHALSVMQISAKEIRKDFFVLLVQFNLFRLL